MNWPSPRKGNAVKDFGTENTSTTRKRVCFATRLSTHSLARRACIAGLWPLKVLHGVAGKGRRQQPQDEEVIVLVISRKPGESLRIGSNIRLVIVRLHKDRVRVGIEAPKDVHIAREELEPLDADVQRTSKR